MPGGFFKLRCRDVLKSGVGLILAEAMFIHDHCQILISMITLRRHRSLMFNFTKGSNTLEPERESCITTVLFRGLSLIFHLGSVER